MSAVSTRRDLLTGVTAAAIGTIVPLPAVPATPAIDPVLVIAAERDRLKVLRDALDEKVNAICAANPEQMAGQGWPRVDRTLAVFRPTRFRHGADVARWEIENMVLLFPDQKAALLQWWDETYALMERRAIESGFRHAIRGLEAACEAYSDKECDMGAVQASTLEGALVKLETALAVIADDGEPDTYTGMALGALADLKRLARRATP